MHTSPRLSLALAVLSSATLDLDYPLRNRAADVLMRALSPDPDSIEARYARLLEDQQAGFGGPALYGVRGWFPHPDGHQQVLFDNIDRGVLLKFPCMVVALKALACAQWEIAQTGGEITGYVIKPADDPRGDTVELSPMAMDAYRAVRDQLAAEKSVEPCAPEPEPLTYSYTVNAILLDRRRITESQDGISCYEDAKALMDRAVTALLDVDATVCAARIDTL